MWDPNTGIEILIKPHGSKDSYHEYKAPTTSKLFAQGRNECFIEAVADERYIIEVIVHPLFQWQKAKHLLVSYQLDGGIVQKNVVLDKPHKPQSVVNELKSFHAYVDGSYGKYSLTFGAVNMVDDPTFLSKGEEDAEISRRGRIQVVLQRGKSTWTKLKRSEIKTRTPEESVFMAADTTKPVHDSGRTHFLKPVPLKSITEGPGVVDTKWHWAEAEKEAGREIVFTFHYTTRAFLECNGVISIIPFPNTADTAIDLELAVPGPSVPSAVLTPRPAPINQDGDDEARFVSAKHIGNAKTRIKPEPGVEHGDEAFAQSAPYPASKEEKSIKRSHHCDDEEQPSHKRTRGVPIPNFNDGNASPSDNPDPGNVQATTQSSAGGAGVEAQGGMVRHGDEHESREAEQDNEEAEILARLKENRLKREEIELNRKLRQLRS